MRIKDWISYGAVLAGAAALAFLLAMPAHPQVTVGIGAIGDPCQDVRIAKVVKTIGTTTATTTAITAVSGSTQTYVCGWFVVTGATAQTLTFEQGTGSSCAANVVALTGAMVTAAAITQLGQSGPGSLFVAGPATGLCIVTGSTSVVNGYVTVVQQ